MAKGSAKSTTNLLRLSGILYGTAGLFHIARYFTHWQFRVGLLELTLTGSLIIGILLALLSIACFNHSK